jgi:hypothetical protein
VGNSPLNFTDPSGNNAIGNFVNAVLASDITYTLVDKADEFWAGFANVVTGGLSNQIREAIYGSSVRCNQQGFVYNLGQVGGVVNTIALGFVSPTQLGAGLSFAQKFALGYEVTNTGVGAYNSTRNIFEGKATGWDALSFFPLASYGGQNIRALGAVDNTLGVLNKTTRKDEFVTLYHGTTSNRASKIVGNLFYETQGFKKTPTFLAEDFNTAEYFGITKLADSTSPNQAKSVSVIEFKIPKQLATELGIGSENRRIIGALEDLFTPDIAGGTGYERVLNSVTNLQVFNQALKTKTISVRRMRVR